ncbi:MAG: hypothetical protein HYY37_00640 [Candidatus Aenigmarchaeota archaeon]|nr:hypothetical protein [Candidatus Aenigmarchaeota archaeon]
MELDRFPVYFLMALLIYIFVLLADLGSFIFAFASTGLLSPEFYFISLFMFLPLLVLAARWKTDFGRNHGSLLGVAFVAAVLLDIMVNLAIFLPLLLT